MGMGAVGLTPALPTLTVPEVHTFSNHRFGMKMQQSMEAEVLKHRG